MSHSSCSYQESTILTKQVGVDWNRETPHFDLKALRFTCGPPVRRSASQDDNVHCVAIKGTFDDCQDIVKEMVFAC